MSGIAPTGPTRAGFVALIGAPNAGKSTLLNRLVGAKLSIVTPKVQTTRTRLRGVVMSGASQLIFVDTPGIFSPRRALDRAMVAAAWDGAGEADLIAVLVDARAMVHRGEGGAAARAAADTDLILERLKEAPRNAVLVLNKVDLVRPPQLLVLAQELNERAPFAETFMISAETGDGVEDFLRYAAEHVPEGPWLYPEDQLTDIPLRQLAAEIVREKLTLRLHDELPYAAVVETEKWDERKDGSVRIEATITVEREGQKAIVLGKGGRTIKEIGQDARIEIAKLIERPVHLFLFVKVREGWSENAARLRDLGFDTKKSG